MTVTPAFCLNDATDYVRHPNSPGSQDKWGADEQDQTCREPGRTVTSDWLFDPDSTLLKWSQEPVSHSVCDALCGTTGASD